MPKIRTLKAEFWEDPPLRRLGDRGRAVYACLITAFADDVGRLEDDPERIRNQAWNQTLPPESIDRELRALEELGKIIRYNVSGAHYIQISEWEEHQYISHPTPSRIPPPVPELLTGAQALRELQRTRSGSIHADSGSLRQLPEDSGGVRQPPEGSGDFRLEGKGREGIGEGLLPSESFQDSSGSNVLTANVALESFATRHPDEFSSLWRRTQNAIQRYESLIPDGKPVTIEDAQQYQEAIGKALETGGAHLRAIEHFSAKGPVIYQAFAAEGIMYAGKPLGQGKFGKNTGRGKRKPKGRETETGQFSKRGYHTS